MNPFSVDANQPTPGGPSGPARPPSDTRRFARRGCAVVAGIVAAFILILGGIVWYQKSHQDIVRQPDGSALPAPRTTVIPGNPAVMASCAMQQGLITRECGILTPPDAGADERLPVIVLLPGIGAGPVDVQSVGDWPTRVVERHFMLVSPQGVGNSWNAGSCCGIASATGVDDVTYLRTLIEEIAKRPDVDPERMYLVGFSNGGMMAYRFACEAGGLLAGVASVSGTKLNGCEFPKPLPVLHIHGTGDQVVPYEGGSGIGGVLMGTTFPAVAGVMDKLAKQQGCDATAKVVDSDTVHRSSWAGCSAPTRLIKIDGFPHEWPLRGALNATTEVLDFFKIER